MHFQCTFRPLFLEPYVASYNITYKYTSAKSQESNLNLPNLPVPKLDDTLQKYLKTVRPHLNDEEFAITSKVIKEFAAEGGVGRKLQVIAIKVNLQSILLALQMAVMSKQLKKSLLLVYVFHKIYHDFEFLFNFTFIFMSFEL